MKLVSDPKAERRQNKDHTHTIVDDLIDSFVSAELARRSDVSRFRRRRSRSRLKMTVGIFLVVLATTAVLQVFSTTFQLPGILADNFGGSNCRGSQAGVTSTSAHGRVALIDSLAPNPDFVENITSSAVKAGYGIDYRPPKGVTLDFLSNLPNQGYSLIILRTHGIGYGATIPAIVTSDPYSPSQRVADQLLNRLINVDVNGSQFFAITSDFVSRAMCGRFPGTLVLAMFCNGVRSTSLANAFTDRGAAAFIGWDNLVTLPFTDMVIKSLVKLLLEGSSLGTSFQEVNRTLGSDPFTGAKLGIFPENEASLTAQMQGTSSNVSA